MLAGATPAALHADPALVDELAAAARAQVLDPRQAAASCSRLTAAAFLLGLLSLGPALLTLETLPLASLMLSTCAIRPLVVRTPTLHASHPSGLSEDVDELRVVLHRGDNELLVEAQQLPHLRASQEPRTQ